MDISFDGNIFVDKVPEHFKCPICLGVASDMVEHTLCDTIYCKECLIQLANSDCASKNSCLVCFKAITGNSVKQANRILVTQFKSLRLSCTNSPDCQMVATRYELDVHEKTCDFNPIICELCHITHAWNGLESHKKNVCIDRLVPCQYCGIEVKFNEHDKHKQQVCLVAPKACKYCKEQITLSTQNEHNKVCKSIPIACTNEGCIDKISRLNYQQHVKSRCPFRLESCFQCKRKVAFSKSQEHISRHCELTKIVCKCGLKLTRGDEAAHFEQDCPTYVVSCPHDGCSFTTARCDLPTHVAQCIYRSLSKEEMLRDKRCRYDKLKHCFSVIDLRISGFCDTFVHYEQFRHFQPGRRDEDLSKLRSLIELREECGFYCRNLKQRTPGFPNSALIANVPNLGLVADLMTVGDWRDVYTISCAAAKYLKYLIIPNYVPPNAINTLKQSGIMAMSVTNLKSFRVYDHVLKRLRPRNESEIASKKLPFRRLLSIDRGNPRFIANIVELKPEHECLRDTVVYTIFRDSILFDTNDSANEYLDLCRVKRFTPPDIYTREGTLFEDFDYERNEVMRAKRPVDGFEFEFKITNESTSGAEDMTAAESFEYDCCERAFLHDGICKFNAELLENGLAEITLADIL